MRLTTTPTLTKEILDELLICDHINGRLFWKERAPHWFSDEGLRSSEHNARLWNSRYAGQEAFTAIGPHGYCVGAIFRKGYRRARIIWMMATGSWPLQIEHRNGARWDDRWDNLRDEPQLVNGKNQKLRSTNKSGINGVRWRDDVKKYAAEICVEGRSIHLGWFDCIDDAAAARLSANKLHGFSDRHGSPE
jgi:hypothetical protein